MKTLFIDTTDRNEVRITIKTPRGNFEKIGLRTTEADITLLTIEKLLQESGFSINEIDDIQIKEGPGSFTGVRIGVSIANTLSFALKKPTNNKDLGEIVEPIYN
jgi:tRNA A37 threonylcarbamoyladenosine modification protein TsaB